MLVVIDNYDSFTYNLVHFLGDLRAETTVFRNDQITIDQIGDLNPDGVVLSPGPCTPNEAGICLDVVNALSDQIPILGVCLGHQAIGQSFGGTVVAAPQLMHGKVSEITCTPHGLFEGLPNAFNVTRYHSLTIDPISLPNCLQVTAQTADGVIMGFSHKQLPVHGVQFHPESIASEYGHELLANFLKMASEWNTSVGRASE
jgi:anthranilate synthase component 2